MYNNWFVPSPPLSHTHLINDVNEGLWIGTQTLSTPLMVYLKLSQLLDLTRLVSEWMIVWNRSQHVMRAYNSGRAWASHEFKRNIWQIRCTYVCTVYVCMLCVWVCMCVAIRRPRVHHACAMCKALHLRIVTLNNAHQRNQPWRPTKKSVHSINREEIAIFNEGKQKLQKREGD